MNKQLIFDDVARHLLKQGRKSIQLSLNNKTPLHLLPRCAYQGEGGLKCAIGALIAKGKYTKRLEGLSTSSPALVGTFRKKYDMRPGPYYGEFLEPLRQIHDMHNPADWKNDLREFAKNWNLDDRILEN